MKKLLFIGCIAFGVSISTVGCKSIPDTDKVEAISTAIGAASGAVCKSTITNEATLVTLCDVMDAVDGLVPATNSNCVTAWYPVITNVVTIAYDKGKITDDEAAIIIDVGMAAAHGVDWLFKTHPSWKQYSDICVVAEKSFVYGFISIIKKKVTFSTSAVNDDVIIIDYDAYEYFNSTYKFDK